MAIYTSLHGQRLGLGEGGQLVTRSSGVDVDVSQKAVNATITVSAEAATTANTRDCVVTLLDSSGVAIDYIEEVEVHMFLNVARTAYVVTGGSTGISLGAAGNGALLAIVAKKVFVCTTESTGILDLDWLDTGTEVAFIGVKLPNGRYVMSSALTNA